MKSKQNLTQNPEINSLARQNEVDACLDARHVEPGLRLRGGLVLPRGIKHNLHPWGIKMYYTRGV